MPTAKRKAIRKAAPVLGAAAAAGLFSVMGTAMAVASPAKPVNLVVLSDEGAGDYHSDLPRTHGFLGKGAVARYYQRG